MKDIYHEYNSCLEDVDFVLFLTEESFIKEVRLEKSFIYR